MLKEKLSHAGARMRVTVTIPVYGNRGTIFQLLCSLEKQSYKRFDVEIVFKHSNIIEEDKRTLDKINGYNLSMSVKKQRSGGIPEAMNMVFGVDSHIVINTDDDAYASKNWVKDHVELHLKYKDIGMATGLVREAKLENRGIQEGIDRLLDRQKWRISNLAAIDPPIDDKFADYGMYIGKSGMLVDTGKRHNMIKTFKQQGVNMSWKGDVMDGLRLPSYAPRGHRYEAYMALQIVRRGYHAVWFDKGINFHEMHESLSRGRGVTTVPLETILTDVLFSYYVSKFYSVDLNSLRLRTQISDAIARAVTLNRDHSYARGYRIAYAAITQKWSPQKVRNALLKEIMG